MIDLQEYSGLLPGYNYEDKMIYVLDNMPTEFQYKVLYKWDGLPTISFCVLHNFPKLFNHILRYYDGVNHVRESDNSTPLHFAVCKGRLDMVKNLLIAGADTNALDSRGFTPTYLTLQSPNNVCFEILKSILLYGGDIFRKYSPDKIDLLKLAIYEEKPFEFIRLLLHSGAHPLDTTVTGVTAMDIARDIGNKQLETLLQMCTNIKVENSLC